MQEFRVDADSAGKRTDVFVAEQFPEFARSALRSLFDEGLVFVNGVQEQPGDKLKAGDIVSVDISFLSPVLEAIDIPVLYEDDDVIVMDKPPGILTHSKGALNLEATVASYIRPKISDNKLSGNRAGIVHRLDRATSGVIVAGKNAQTVSKLQKQFSQRKTKKIYIAIVEGIPEPSEAVIDIAIERDPKKPQTFRANSHGKTAQTTYKVLKTFQIEGRPCSMLELKPTTGRTHQLRVHLAYIGHPIVGDKVYGTGGDNLMLHASSLELTLPGGKRKIFTAPLPEHIKEMASV
jgi:23S rRNA pseudouridine1911/1915/1917 synthase